MRGGPSSLCPLPQCMPQGRSCSGSWCGGSPGAGRTPCRAALSSSALTSRLPTFSFQVHQDPAPCRASSAGTCAGQEEFRPVLHPWVVQDSGSERCAGPDGTAAASIPARLRRQSGVGRGDRAIAPRSLSATPSAGLAKSSGSAEPGGRGGQSGAGSPHLSRGPAQRRSEDGPRRSPVPVPGGREPRGAARGRLRPPCDRGGSGRS